MISPVSDAVQRIDQFATRSESAAEAVRQMRRGHLLRLHSRHRFLDDRGVKAWHDFAEHLSCALARPIIADDLEYRMRLDVYSKDIPLIPVNFPPLNGIPLTANQELDVIDTMLASIDYPLSAEGEGHEQLGRGILHHTGITTPNISVDASCSIGSLAVVALDSTRQQTRPIDFATALNATLNQNAGVLTQLDVPSDLLLELQSALTTSANRQIDGTEKYRSLD